MKFPTNPHSLGYAPAIPMRFSDPPPHRATMPSPAATRHLCLWWRRRGRRFAVAATFAAALFLSLSYYAAAPASPSPSSSGRRPNLVGLTLVRRAKEKGALCLDGSAPGYHLQRGFGGGSQNWIIHLEDA